jgi:hypothetical protein
MLFILITLISFLSIPYTVRGEEIPREQSQPTETHDTNEEGTGEGKTEPTDCLTREQYEWAAKSRKYDSLAFSITEFDIDRVNEYALEFKKNYPDWPENSTLRNFDAKHSAKWSGCVGYRKNWVQQECTRHRLSQEAMNWACFCNAHGQAIHKSVVNDLNGDNPEKYNKALDFLRMRNELCTQPKLYAKKNN